MKSIGRLLLVAMCVYGTTQRGDAQSAEIRLGNMKAESILFLGNSITATLFKAILAHSAVEQRDDSPLCDPDHPAPSQVTPPAAEKSFLFSYFTGNGEDGLHLAASADGVRWDSLRAGKSFLAPEVGGKLMRDPCITLGPDGTFHMVWTTGWWDQGIGLAHSPDLVHWSPQQWIPVMKHEPQARNCWAPEILYDPGAEQYLIYWSTTIPGRFPETEAADGDKMPEGGVCNHRIYYTTTPDFQTFTKTALLYDPGFNCIDATIIPKGGKWAMFIKDETKSPVAKKHIRIAWADQPTGPWSAAGKPISPDWVEGPTALQVGDSWLLYYDAYTRGHYEGLRSLDLKTWESLDNQLSFPEGTRHGTAFAVTPEVAERLKQP